MTQKNKTNLDTRTRPRQERSQQTMGRILAATAELLEEVGFEKLSTNMICQRAGMTPPALYRYFPNKYAVLKELGERLMDKQNALFEEGMHSDFSPEEARDWLIERLRKTYELTKEEIAGVWITRSLYASPVLSEVRLNSHRTLAQTFAAALRKQNPELTSKEAYRRARFNVEIGYSVIEMLLDEPELDIDRTLSDAAGMVLGSLIRPSLARGRAND